MPRSVEELREIRDAIREALEGERGDAYSIIRCSTCELDTPHVRITSKPMDDKGSHVFQCLACNERVTAVYEKPGPAITVRVVEERKIIGFDIEIAKELPEGEEDWSKHMPLGISCMAAWIPGEGYPHPWHTLHEVDGMIDGAMRAGEVDDVVCWLHEMQQDKGYKIITWNGAGFDFQVLSAECSRLEMVREIAWDHIDLAFQMLCEKGYMIGLNTAAKGLGVEGKLEGMSGDVAPVMWGQDRDAQQKVLKYVGQDARMTGQVYEALLKYGELVWITKKGYRTKSPWTPTFQGNAREKGRLLTVRECLKLPRVDTSWMDKPWARSDFVGWLLKEDDDARGR